MDSNDVGTTARAGSGAEKKRIDVISQASWWTHAPRPPSRRLHAPAFARLLRGRTLVVLARAESIACFLHEADGDVEATVHRLPGPMGLAYAEGRLAIGCAADVRVFFDVGGDGDGAFLPLGVHATGAISIHDLAWDDDRLWLANTLFSTICTLGVDGVRARWRPAFVADPSSPGDACHLNGMVVAGGGVRFATALAATGDTSGWRSLGPDHGVVLGADGDVRHAGLSMPHSPLLHDDRLLVLESGRGRLLALEPSRRVLAEFPGVVRGLAAAPDALFVARSPVRASSGATADLLATRFPPSLPCALHACTHGGDALAVLELPFLAEIASLHLLPLRRATLLRPEPPQHAGTYVVAT